MISVSFKHKAVMAILLLLSLTTINHILASAQTGDALELAVLSVRNEAPSSNGDSLNGDRNNELNRNENNNEEDGNNALHADGNNNILHHRSFAIIRPNLREVGRCCFCVFSLFYGVIVIVSCLGEFVYMINTLMYADLLTICHSIVSVLVLICCIIICLRNPTNTKLIILGILGCASLVLGYLAKDNIFTMLRIAYKNDEMWKNVPQAKE